MINYPYKLTSQSSDVQVPRCPLPGGGLQLQQEALLLLAPQLHGLLVPQLRPRLEVEAVHVSLHRLHLLTQPRPPLLQCPGSKGVNEIFRVGECLPVRLLDGLEGDGGHGLPAPAVDVRREPGLGPGKHC